MTGDIVAKTQEGEILRGAKDTFAVATKVQKR
jgi:hypothetical protein